MKKQGWVAKATTFLKTHLLAIVLGFGILRLGFLAEKSGQLNGFDYFVLVLAFLGTMQAVYKEGKGTSN